MSCRRLCFCVSLKAKGPNDMLIRFLITRTSPSPASATAHVAHQSSQSTSKQPKAKGLCKVQAPKAKANQHKHKIISFSTRHSRGSAYKKQEGRSTNRHDARGYRYPGG